ncbi:hypothetical protein Nepgr_006179 [Nepenthes gracilis]|uniref:Uncharacterized protein n=1 Tax=Nepenthes gracilis TaxID=150966 RepID=A0AAD3S517_NEPGR|nr:hypothetical protein Nepgr_006179 [Nepenthes gracilis]
MKKEKLITSLSSVLSFSLCLTDSPSPLFFSISSPLPRYSAQRLFCSPLLLHCSRLPPRSSADTSALYTAVLLFILPPTSSASVLFQNFIIEQYKFQHVHAKMWLKYHFHSIGDAHANGTGG